MKILQTKMLFLCAEFFLWVFKKWGVIYGRNQEEIHGRSAHGSAPDQGKDAIVAAAVVVMGLQTLSSRVNDPQNTFVLTVGMMNGGTQSNIIADEVELVGTTRAFDVDEDTFSDGSAIYARFAIDCLKKLGKH